MRVAKAVVRAGEENESSQGSGVLKIKRVAKAVVER